MLWLIIAILAALAAAILLYALIRRSGTAAARADYDVEVFRAQLQELERELDSGLLTEGEAEAARTEIQRRMLAVDAARPQAAQGGRAGLGPVPAAGIALAVPAAAVGLYFVLGSPGIPSVPFAGRPAPSAAQAAHEGAPGQSVPDVASMMAQLEQRLAQDPNDLQGWVMLARSHAALGEFDAAVTAYDRAIALAGDEPDLYGGKAEAMIMAAQGQVTPAARAAIDKALALDPHNARARYYLAAAKQQAGDSNGAFDDLVTLLRGAPADAPWYSAVREQAVNLAKELGVDPETALPAPRAVAEAPQGAAPATTPAPADPRAAAEKLAARLDQNPKDFRGWIELARLRAGLGDTDGARTALDRGAAAFPGAPFVQQQFRQAAAELGLAGQSADSGTRGPSAEDVQAAQQMTPAQQQEMIRGMVGNLAERLKNDPNDLKGWQMLARSYGVLGERDKAVEAYRHVLTLDASNGDALFFLGDAARQAGDKSAAADYWTRLLAQLPPGSAEHSMVKDRLDALGATN